MRLFTNLIFKYTTYSLIRSKSKIFKKICFKQKYKFLNKKNSPSKALTTRLMNNGFFLKLYKKLRYFFYKIILQNQSKYIPVTSNFLFFFKKYNSFKDFDRVLLWRFNQLNCMFSFKKKEKKKKKKKKKEKELPGIYIKFIKPERRFIVCLNFLKYIIMLLMSRKKKNLTPNLFLPLYRYLMYDRDNLVVKLKYKVYKYKLMNSTD